MQPDRLLIFVGGLLGASGVAFSAVASHAADTSNIGTVASFLLAHAPAFLALAFVSRETFVRSGTWVLLAGIVIFCGDLLARDYLGTRLFPYAAPVGGTTMILGWLAIALTGLFLPSLKPR